MARPGTQVLLRETPPPISVPTDTTSWFVAGLADRGPTAPYRITSMAQFEKVFGLRQTYSVLYDALDIYFREGGGSAWVSRVVGPTSTLGTRTLLDAGAGVSLTVNARDPGAFSTGIKVGVVAGSVGGTYQIQVTDASNVVLEQSGDLTTQQDAIGWSSRSNYIRIVLGATALVPVVVAPAALSAGTDDRTNITDADWLVALDRFGAELGPGQVSSPGRTSDVAHTQILAHAQSHNRRAILDLPDSRTPATLKTSVVNARAGNQRWGAAFTPWTLHAGVVQGTMRTVPPSATVAGIIARNEDEYGPDAPSAGVRGESFSAIALTQTPYSDTERQDLNDNSVNVILQSFGAIRVYGWRTLVAPAADPAWVGFANSRLAMAITAEGQAIAEQYVFDILDGQGKTLASFAGALTGMLMRHYDQGALYGPTPNEAFTVDVGPQVNTADTIANNELRARLNVRMSPMAELVTIEIVKTPITQAVVA
jgi:phage tail sheath protein FI